MDNPFRHQTTVRCDFIDQMPLADEPHLHADTLTDQYGENDVLTRSDGTRLVIGYDGESYNWTAYERNSELDDWTSHYSDGSPDQDEAIAAVTEFVNGNM